jgi:aldose 1-epimerase
METIRIAGNDLEVIVLPEVGARLHALRAFGRDLLRTPEDPEAHRSDPFAWGGYVMAPWCNRVAAAPTEVGGHVVALQANIADGAAIHGQVSAVPWRVLGDGLFGVEAGGRDGWPWPYEVMFGVEIADDVLRLDLQLTNRARSPMPGGIGIHPWFMRPLEVAIHGDLVYPDNLASAPTPQPVAGATDLRALGDFPVGLDAAWTDLADPPVELRWPAHGLAATWRVTGPTPHIVAARLADRDAVAIEPQTHAPQGLRRLLRGEPGALAMLDPDETLRLTIDLAFRRVAD